jgi:hypothetical protein
MACRPIEKGGILTVSAGLINCTGSHVVTQAQMNAGVPIVNTVSVSFANAASQNANVSTVVLQQPSLAVTKEADRFTADAAGQVKEKKKEKNLFFSTTPLFLFQGYYVRNFDHEQWQYRFAWIVDCGSFDSEPFYLHSCRKWSSPHGGISSNQMHFHVHGDAAGH